MARDLVDDFERNEIAALGRYKDKALRIAGTITEIKMMLGDPVLTMRGRGFQSVHCFFEKRWTEDLSKFGKGFAVVECESAKGGAMGGVAAYHCKPLTQGEIEEYPNIIPPEYRPKTKR